MEPYEKQIPPRRENERDQEDQNDTDFRRMPPQEVNILNRDSQYLTGDDISQIFEPEDLERTWNNGLTNESMAALTGRKDDNKAIEKKWKEIHKEYLNRYPLIRPEDVAFQTQKFDTLIERIANRTRRTSQELKMEIQNWQPSLYTRYDM